jgi:hypothetical protein
MADQEPPQPFEVLPAGGPGPADDERTTDPLVRRWSGSAPVPHPPARRRRRWRIRDDDAPVYRADYRKAASGGPAPAHRTLELPADELAALRRGSAAGLPIPVTAPLPESFVPGYPAAAYPVPDSPAPRALVPLRPAAPARSARPPALPPGWPTPASWVPIGYPPPGWELRRRRRRRWPWVMLMLGLLTVACCCGCPALLAKPFWD